MGGSTTAAGGKLGRYQIVKHLASGGMAEVLLARATGIEGFTRHVVIKRIRPGQAKDQTFVQMFLNEARLAAQLHHANIVQVHDIGQEGNEYFFAMEYVHGEDLRRLLTNVARNRQKVPLEHVVTIISAAAVALHHAHEQRGADRKPLGIVHRDVTPANILVGYDGNVKVVDFGIAKAAARSEETQAGTLKGKASYMAPEQCTGSKIDRRSDVFALGIVLYELVTARRLFKAENDFLTMSAIVAGNVPPARQHRPDIPDAFEAIIRKALALRPEDRYQTADAMREALEQFASNTGLRTSTSALAAYMKQQFGVRPEPWLVDDDDDELELVIDFDGSASALVSPPSESIHQLAVPTSVEAMQSSPILKARTKAITMQPAASQSARREPDGHGEHGDYGAAGDRRADNMAGDHDADNAAGEPYRDESAPGAVHVGVAKRALPLSPTSLPTAASTGATKPAKPMTAQIPALGATPPASERARPFRIDSAPVPVARPSRRNTITVQIPIATQAAGTTAPNRNDGHTPLPGIAPGSFAPSSGVPDRLADVADSDSIKTFVADAPRDVDSDWDLGSPIATGSSSNMRADEAPKPTAAGTKPDIEKPADAARGATATAGGGRPTGPGDKRSGTSPANKSGETTAAPASTRAASEPKVPAGGGESRSDSKPVIAVPRISDSRPTAIPKRTDSSPAKAVRKTRDSKPAIAVPKASESSPAIAIPKTRDSKPAIGVPTSSDSSPTPAVAKTGSSPAIAIPKTRDSKPAIGAPKASESSPAIAVPKTRDSEPVIGVPKPIESKAGGAKRSDSSPAIDAPKANDSRPTRGIAGASDSSPSIGIPKLRDSSPAIAAPSASDSGPAIGIPKLRDSGPAIAAPKASGSSPAVAAPRASDSSGAIGAAKPGEASPATRVANVNESSAAMAAAKAGEASPAMAAANVNESSAAMAAAKAGEASPAIAAAKVGEASPTIAAAKVGEASPTIAAPKVGEASPAMAAAKAGESSSAMRVAHAGDSSVATPVAKPSDSSPATADATTTSSSAAATSASATRRTPPLAFAHLGAKSATTAKPLPSSKTATSSANASQPIVAVPPTSAATHTSAAADARAVAATPASATPAASTTTSTAPQPDDAKAAAPAATAADAESTAMTPPLFAGEPLPPVLPKTAASTVTAPSQASAGVPKPWSLADMARSDRAGVRNDVSAASRFDVASLSSSRTDVSGLDAPIAVTVTPTASAGFEVDVDGNDDDGAVAALADGRDSAPSLPPPPNTRKSIKLPGVAELPGDDPEDPVIDPPRPALPRQQAGIAAIFGARAAFGPQPHGAPAQPDAWASTSSRSSDEVVGTVRALLGSRRRIAIIAGVVALSIGGIVLATRGGNEASPVAAPDKASHEPSGDEHEAMQPTTDKPTAPVESGTLDEPAAEPGADDTDDDSADGSADAADTQPDTTDSQATTEKPAPATTKPAVTPTKHPAPTRPHVTHTKPATTKPATTKPATTKPATTKPATKRPPAKHSPAKHPPTKKPSWDPNQLFPKKK